MTNTRATPIVVLSLFWCGTAAAQQATGAIAGRVFDPQGSAVPGATVTARNPQTGFVRTEASDRAGIYRLAALPVAAYELTVETPGFATLARRDVGVSVAQTTSVDFVLRIAEVTQVVTVTGDLPAIDVTSSSVGHGVDVERVQGLPLNGRQFANLAATLPGVGLGFHSDPTKGTSYAPQINGGAGRNINYQIDGGDNNDDTTGGLLQQFPLEAIQEFHFETQRFKAEYGRSNGGVMNVVTRSGTNRFQGTLFELFRDKAMNALTATERLAGVAAGGAPKKGGYRRNQFGGSFGGPLMLNRVHFFLAAERTQQDTTQTVNTKILSDLDGVYPTLYRENLGTAKISANLNTAQHLTVRYGRNTNRFPFGVSPTTTHDHWDDANNRFNSTNVNHTWVLGGTRSNELIVQYSTYRDHMAPRTTDSTLIFPNGVRTGASMTAPQSTEQVKYQIRDDFSWRVAGFGGLGHELKAGVNYIHEPRLFIETTGTKNVRVHVMLDNDPSGLVQAITVNDGEAAVNIPTRQYGFYMQDDWRVSDRLTVNAGVRYDLVTGLVFDQSKNPNFVKVQAAAKAGALDDIEGLENFGLDPQSDRNNVQPRIGAVYDITGTGRNIVRGGWGVYTDFGYTNSNVLVAALDASGTRFGPVFTASDHEGLKNDDGSDYQVGQSLEGLEGQNEANLDDRPLIGFWADPRLQQPYQLQTNAGWSHRLTADTVIGVDYVNSLGRDLNFKPRVNQFIPGITPRTRRVSARLSSELSPNTSGNRPALSRGVSRYNALILSGRRRFAGGFDFLASYMLSKGVSNIGNASDELNTANIQDANDPFDNPVQLGPNVTTDARHRINISAVIRFPYGVQVAPFFLYRSALPIFLVDGRDLNGDGERNDIPDEAFAVVSTDSATGQSTFKSIGPCETVNCGRGWPQSQMNLRISKVFRAGPTTIEAIAEVFNLFNATNPSNITGSTSANRRVFDPALGAADPTLLQPASYSGDSQRPEQRVGQIGIRFTF